MPPLHRPLPSAEPPGRRETERYRSDGRRRPLASDFRFQCVPADDGLGQVLGLAHALFSREGPARAAGPQSRYFVSHTSAVVV